MGNNQPHLLKFDNGVATDCLSKNTEIYIGKRF